MREGTKSLGQVPHCVSGLNVELAPQQLYIHFTTKHCDDQSTCGRKHASCEILTLCWATGC